MPNETPQPPRMHATAIRRWEDKDARKRLNQLNQRLNEFLAEMKTAQASVLLKTKEEYKERQAQFFVGQIQAVELTSTLIAIAQSGMLLSPDGWQEEPKE